MLSISDLNDKYLPRWKSSSANVQPPKDVFEYISVAMRFAMLSLKEARTYKKKLPRKLICLDGSDWYLFFEHQKMIESQARIFAELYDDVKQSDLDERQKNIISFVHFHLEQRMEEWNTMEQKMFQEQIDLANLTPNETIARKSFERIGTSIVLKNFTKHWKLYST